LVVVVIFLSRAKSGVHAPVLTLSVRAFFFQIHFDIGLNDFSGSLPTELGRLVALEYGFNVEPRDGTRGAALLRLNDAAIPTEVAALSSAVRRRVLESAPGAYDDGHMWRASPPPRMAERSFRRESATLAGAGAEDRPKPQIEVEDGEGGRKLVAAIGDNLSLRVAVKKWCSDPTAAEVEYGHISEWDTSSVTDMSHLFGRTGHCDTYATFDEDITAWNGR
jgi:hypothetical protein